MSRPTRRIGMLASRVRVDEHRLFEAFERRGVDCVHLDGRTLHGEAGGLRPADVVLNREISLTRAVYGASLLESCGVEVLNPAAVVRRCGDKWETTRALVEAGIPTPTTTLATTPEAALAVVEAAAGPLVVKPLTGSWGRRVGRIDRHSAALLLDHVAALPSPQSHVVYLQELVDDAEADVRVLVVGDEAVGACSRSGPGLCKNVARGASVAPYPLTDELAKTAVAAAQCVGAELAGVDVLVHPDRGLLVLEVNAGVEFSGLQSALGEATDVAAAVVDHVVRKAS